MKSVLFGDPSKDDNFVLLSTATRVPTIIFAAARSIFIFRD